MKNKKEWFLSWFDTTYYNLLYKKRNQEEADLFINNLQTLIPFNCNNLLDVGCGNGRHALAFSKYCSFVIGIDLSKNKIGEAKEKQNDQTSFYVHDMRSPFLNKAFDIVTNLFTSFGYCENEKDNDIFFDNMCNAIIPEGFFIIDYLNVEAYKHTKPTDETLIIENVNFNIHKYQDDIFFYKKISIEDKEKKQSFVYQEAVRKYTLNNFLEKLKKNNLTVIYQFGNYKLEPINIKSSPRLIIIAKKNN